MFINVIVLYVELKSFLVIVIFLLVIFFLHAVALIVVIVVIIVVYSDVSIFVKLLADKSIAN